MKTEEFTFRVIEHYDSHADLSFIGEFSDTPKDGAINHRKRSGERYVYKYFNPANPEYAEQDYKRMMEIKNGYVWFIGIEVKCFKKGIELGSASLWGIESDCGQRYKDEVIADLKAEVLAEAKHNLDKLKKD